MSDRLLNVKEVAALLGLAPASIYHFAAAKRIPFVRLSARCLRFRASEIQQFIEKLAETGPSDTSRKTERSHPGVQSVRRTYRED